MPVLDLMEWEAHVPGPAGVSFYALNHGVLMRTVLDVMGRRRVYIPGVLSSVLGRMRSEMLVHSCRGHLLHSDLT
jgi:hypothetical protein